MKRFFLLFLFYIISLCFTSCSKFNLFSESKTPYHYEILKEINDTITNYPEIALELLKKIDSTTINNNFSEQEYHEYQILVSEAYYKNYYNQSNFNEIINASNYFDSLASLYPRNVTIAFLNSKVKYYRGVQLEELGDTEEAFKNYIKSLESIENINLNRKNCRTFHKDILHFKALTYTRLSDILYWNDVYIPAIECFTNANELFTLEDNQNALSRNNIILAIIYGLNNDHNKALYHLAIADSILALNNISSTLKNDIESIKASILYNIGYKEEAFNSVIKQYKTLDNTEQAMNIAGILGDMYYEQKNYDSAIYYYEKYFPYNKYSKINASNNIIEISIITGNEELITKYAKSLAEETNKEITLSSTKTKLSSLYHQYSIKKNDKKFYNVFFTQIILISITIIIVFLFGLYLTKIKKRNYNKKITEKSNYIDSLKKIVEKTSSENKHIKSHIKSLENEIIEIKNRNSIDHISFEKKIDSMKKNAVYKKMLDVCSNHSIKTNVEYPEFQLNDNEQKELIELFNTTFNYGLSKIISEHRGLKHYDLLYFCLYIIGLDEKRISAVTGNTYNTVWNRTKKIQKILGSDKNIKDIIKKELLY